MYHIALLLYVSLTPPVLADCEYVIVVVIVFSLVLFWFHSCFCLSIVESVVAGDPGLCQATVEHVTQAEGQGGKGRPAGGRAYGDMKYFIKDMCIKLRHK